MFLQNNNPRFKDQKNTKPKIEDITLEILDEDKNNNVLEFISYLKTNKMSTHWASVNSWKIVHKGKDISFFKLYDNSWYIDPIVDYKDSNFVEYIKKEKLEKILQKNVELCTNCLPNGQCTPGRSVEILGKQYKNICHTIRFINPNSSEINCIKKLFEYRKGIISDNKVQKTFYIGKAKREELIKLYGDSNVNLGYNAIMIYINRDVIMEKPKNLKDQEKFFKIYSEIMDKNPKYNFIKLFETGLKEYLKK